MKEPKVLVVTPTHSADDYCIFDCIKSVNNFDYSNYRHILIDNSKKDKYYKKLKKHTKYIFKIPRGKDTREAINNSMNFGRLYALEYNYDYMLVVESDLTPRPDTIRRLINHNKAIVGSYYLLGFKKDTEKINRNIELYNKKSIDLKELKRLNKKLNPQTACLFKLDNKDNYTLGTKILKLKEGFEYYQTGLREIHGAGMGCTLIRKDIVKRFPFWTDSRFVNKHHDVYFYFDLYNEGIKVYVDTDVLVPHKPNRFIKKEIERLTKK